MNVFRALWILMAVSTVFAGSAQAAAKAELWPRWQAHDDSSTATISHEAFDRLLALYVKPGSDGINRVAYGRVSATDKVALTAYVTQLQALPISKHSRAEQRAYWINLYNAETLRLVLAYYPVASIRDIKLGGSFTARLFGGPWAAKTMKVEGVGLSLDDIEHRILRPIWRDPRTHYTVNCASLGCPNLAARAYTPARMAAMLDEGARAFINQPRGVRIAGGKATVSSIYQWFAEDFGGDEAGVLTHLRQYSAPAQKSALASVTSLQYGDYNWALNEAR